MPTGKWEQGADDNAGLAYELKSLVKLTGYRKPRMATTATSHGSRTRPTLLSVAFAVLLVSMARAQQPAAAGQESKDLAKQLSNPLASLVSVPFQFNWEQNVGPSKLTRFVLNVQPVMPFTVNEKVNLIVRLIAPFISQPPLTESGTATFGMGDITTSFFVAPSKSAKLIWGAGPVIVLPSTSDPALGSGKWSLGPTIIALKQRGELTVGALWNQTWSFAGDDARPDVNQMFLQPFLSYQATHTLTLTVQSEMTANWDAPSDDDTWTIPINVPRGQARLIRALPSQLSGRTWRLPRAPRCRAYLEAAVRNRAAVPAGPTLTSVH